eukprot:snap_masked-scaffold_4-processed-gene-13.17-mRNA-1 protein AED:1.00 eAED:1.00 QI:0/0/0/0/1/1/3/0/1727
MLTEETDLFLKAAYIWKTANEFNELFILRPFSLQTFINAIHAKEESALISELVCCLVDFILCDFDYTNESGVVRTVSGLLKDQLNIITWPYYVQALVRHIYGKKEIKAVENRILDTDLSKPHIDISEAHRKSQNHANIKVNELLFLLKQNSVIQQNCKLHEKEFPISFESHFCFEGEYLLVKRDILLTLEEEFGSSIRTPTFYKFFEGLLELFSQIQINYSNSYNKVLFTTKPQSMAYNRSKVMEIEDNELLVSTLTSILTILHKDVAFTNLPLEEKLDVLCFLVDSCCDATAFIEEIDKRQLSLSEEINETNNIKAQLENELDFLQVKLGTHIEQIDSCQKAINKELQEILQTKLKNPQDIFIGRHVYINDLVGVILSPVQTDNKTMQSKESTLLLPGCLSYSDIGLGNGTGQRKKGRLEKLRRSKRIKLMRSTQLFDCGKIASSAAQKRTGTDYIIRFQNGKQQILGSNAIASSCLGLKELPSEPKFFLRFREHIKYKNIEVVLPLYEQLLPGRAVVLKSFGYARIVFAQRLGTLVKLECTLSFGTIFLSINLEAEPNMDIMYLEVDCHEVEKLSKKRLSHSGDLIRDVLREKTEEQIAVSEKKFSALKSGRIIFSRPEFFIKTNFDSRFGRICFFPVENYLILRIESTTFFPVFGVLNYSELVSLHDVDSVLKLLTQKAGLKKFPVVDIKEFEAVFNMAKTAVTSTVVCSRDEHLRFDNMNYDKFIPASLRQFGACFQQNLSHKRYSGIALARSQLIRLLDNIWIFVFSMQPVRNLYESIRKTLLETTDVTVLLRILQLIEGVISSHLQGKAEPFRKQVELVFPDFLSGINLSTDTSLKLKPNHFRDVVSGIGTKTLRFGTDLKITLDEFLQLSPEEMQDRTDMSRFHTVRYLLKNFITLFFRYIIPNVEEKTIETVFNWATENGVPALEVRLESTYGGRNLEYFLRARTWEEEIIRLYQVLNHTFLKEQKEATQIGELVREQLRENGFSYLKVWNKVEAEWRDILEAAVRNGGISPTTLLKSIIVLEEATFYLTKGLSFKDLQLCSRILGAPIPRSYEFQADDVVLLDRLRYSEIGQNGRFATPGLDPALDYLNSGLVGFSDNGELIQTGNRTRFQSSERFEEFLCFYAKYFLGGRTPYCILTVGELTLREKKILRSTRLEIPRNAKTVPVGALKNILKKSQVLGNAYSTMISSNNESSEQLLNICKRVESFASEKYCFFCFEGGELLRCDFRKCPYRFHFNCLFNDMVLQQYQGSPILEKQVDLAVEMDYFICHLHQLPYLEQDIALLSLIVLDVSNESLADLESKHNEGAEVDGINVILANLRILVSYQCLKTLSQFTEYLTQLIDSISAGDLHSINLRTISEVKKKLACDILNELKVKVIKSYKIHMHMLANESRAELKEKKLNVLLSYLTDKIESKESAAEARKMLKTPTTRNRLSKKTASNVNTLRASRMARMLESSVKPVNSLSESRKRSRVLGSKVGGGPRSVTNGIHFQFYSRLLPLKQYYLSGTKKYLTSLTCEDLSKSLEVDSSFCLGCGNCEIRKQLGNQSYHGFSSLEITKCIGQNNDKSSTGKISRPRKRRTYVDSDLNDSDFEYDSKDERCLDDDLTWEFELKNASPFLVEVNQEFLSYVNKYSFKKSRNFKPAGLGSSGRLMETVPKLDKFWIDCLVPEVQRTGVKVSKKEDIKLITLTVPLVDSYNYLLTRKGWYVVMKAQQQENVL